MRMFIALQVPPDICRVLESAQEGLRTVTEGGNYVRAGNFHVTLHFIGESNDLYGAAGAIDRAVRGIHPILLRLNGLGRFKKAESFTAYMGLNGDLDELNRLHESLISALMDMGFPHGRQKRLVPHITLARKLIPQTPDGFETLDTDINHAFTADRLFLYASRYIDGRLFYMPLHAVRLR